MLNQTANQRLSRFIDASEIRKYLSEKSYADVDKLYFTQDLNANCNGRKNKQTMWDIKYPNAQIGEEMTGYALVDKNGNYSICKSLWNK